MNPTIDAASAPHIGAYDGKDLLTFMLGMEEYGIQTCKVRELYNYKAIAQANGAPLVLVSRVALQDRVVPVIDMRLLFNVPSPSYDDSTLVILLNIHGGTAGIVVDSLHDVIQLLPEQVEPPRDVGAPTRIAYLAGLGVLDQREVGLIDIDKLIVATVTESIAQFPACIEGGA